MAEWMDQWAPSGGNDVTLRVFFARTDGSEHYHVGVIREDDPTDEVTCPIRCPENLADQLRDDVASIEPEISTQVLRRKLKDVLARFGILYEV